ncbi:ComEA family DNA-binding protein [Planctomicrobium sp. SH668]|uniref:ComEA family DNA-binding protein n=1 Tax=Planctomicrobium sp. SH668 TaxID=3448126 RepID=UPI003F5B0C72
MNDHIAESHLHPIEENNELLQPEPKSPPGSADSVALGFNRSDRLFVTFLCSVIVALILAHLVRMSVQGTPRVEIVRLPQHDIDFKIQMNRATWVEWMQLPQIGEVTARNIVADRDQRGPFLAVEDLTRVKGVGPATMAAVRSFLVVDELQKSDLLSNQKSSAVD